MSSTAASGESIRTQASTQSCRPGTGWLCRRIRMPAGLPDSAASCLPRGDSRTRARWMPITPFRSVCRRLLPSSSLVNPSMSWKPPSRPRTA